MIISNDIFHSLPHSFQLYDPLQLVLSALLYNFSRCCLVGLQPNKSSTYWITVLGTSRCCKSWANTLLNIEGEWQNPWGKVVYVSCWFSYRKAKRYCESGCVDTLKNAEHKLITVYYHASGGMLVGYVWEVWDNGSFSHYNGVDSFLNLVPNDNHKNVTFFLKKNVIKIFLGLFMPLW